MKLMTDGRRSDRPGKLAICSHTCLWVVTISALYSWCSLAKNGIFQVSPFCVTNRRTAGRTDTRCDRDARTHIKMRTKNLYLNCVHSSEWPPNLSEHVDWIWVNFQWVMVNYQGIIYLIRISSYPIHKIYKERKALTTIAFTRSCYVL